MSGETMTGRFCSREILGAGKFGTGEILGGSQDNVRITPFSPKRSSFAFAALFPLPFR